VVKELEMVNFGACRWRTETMIRPWARDRRLAAPERATFEAGGARDLSTASVASATAADCRRARS
jgi:hypothetical protein